MTNRFICSPKAWVYTKNAEGKILDLTNYVTAGEVNRLINQVSTANVTLRNPKKIFTTPSKGVAFHPMDPITIYLERIAGHPVQVFTGYLDRTPYYQMYPGTITIQASCTLKKILYSFFDPSLPYVVSFLERFGWVNKGNGAIVSEEAFKASQVATENPTQLTPFKNDKNALNDGGMGKLLWALIYYIAEWKDEKIYVEALPAGVPKLVETLMTDFQQGAAQEKEDFEQFWKAIIGTESHGSGGTTGKTGEVKEQKKIVETIAKIATQKGLPPAFVLTTCKAESGLSPDSVGEEGAKGYFQFTSSEPYPGIKVNFPADAKDLGISCEAFCKAALKKGIKPESQWEEWAKTTQGSVGYPHWPSELVEAKELLSKYGKKAINEPEEEATKTQKGTTGKTEKSESTSGRTRITAMLDSAKEISSKHYEYVWGGGHAKAGSPDTGSEGGSVVGFDCSGAVAAILSNGGYIGHGSVGAAGEFGDYQSKDTLPGPAPQGSNPSVTVYYEPEHTFMIINGTEFTAHHHGQGAVLENTGQSTAGFNSFHFTVQSLEQPWTQPAAPLTGGSEGASEGGGAEGENAMGTAKAVAFTSELTFPTLQEEVKAIALKGQKSMLNNQSLFPFVQQVAQASMRSFQSLPNGDFFAFYPDYFGEMGHRKPYWLIKDIEILNGGIELSDDNLATHVYAIGDNTWPINNELVNQLFSAGTITIFNAFESLGVLQRAAPGVGPNGIASVMTKAEAVEFLKRYGPRPLVTDLPMVRSPVYEMLMAYQQFMLAWSRQFLTPFEFTFMPELFPGGKVGFPEHGLQMYIESVNHQWSLETGFTTSAQLSAPSLMEEGEGSTNNESLPPNMVSALTEPIAPAKEANPPKKITVGKTEVRLTKSEQLH